MNIVLVGPCAPVDLAHLFCTEDSIRAKNFSGYRGIPVSNLASALTDLGHQVTVITTSTSVMEGTLTFSGEGIKILVVPSRKRAKDLALTFFRRERALLLKEINSAMPDIVHAHWTYEFALAGISSKKPLVITAHDAPVTIFKYFRDPYRFFRLLLAIQVSIRTSNLVFVSPYLMKQWKKEMLWHGESSVIPNIIPFPANIPIDIKNREKNILVISDGSSLKNVKKLIETWPLVLAIHPSAQLYLVGDGLDIDSKFAKWSNERDLNRSITWLGYLARESILQLIRNSLLLVHPSLEESFGLSILEAMSQGLPVIGGINSGGVPFVIGDAGILVDVRNPEEIARSIIELITDDELRRRLSMAGLERIELMFSPRVIANQYLAVYERVLGQEDS